jgi:hypothetical protein
LTVPVQIDHEALAVSRLASQFAESPNLQGYLRALMSESNNLEEALQECLLRSIDTSEGDVLDVLGQLVGQERVVIDATDLMYFGFAGHPKAGSFGDVDQPWLGSRFKSASEVIGNVRIPEDPEYRLLIRARIAQNSSKGTIEDLIRAIGFLVEADEIRVEEPAEATVRIGIGRLLTANEKSLILTSNLIPKPAGVRISEMYEYEADNVFGFLGVIGAKGFNVGRFAGVIQ